MKVLSPQQLLEAEKRFMASEGLTMLDLTERVARGMADIIKERWPKGKGKKKVVVFAGSGGNGCDGLAVARLLLQEGYDVDVHCFTFREHTTPECRTNHDRFWELAPERIHEVGREFTPPMLDKDTLVVDALFGTGLDRNLVGGYAAIVKVLNSSPAEVVAIDLPSGLLHEDNSHNVLGHIVKAKLTLACQTPMLALLMADMAPFFGEVRVVDAGVPEAEIDQEDSPYVMLDARLLGKLPQRPNYAHKGDFGHGLLLAGKYGMAGAAVLAARACLRAGIGKLTVHTPTMNNTILQIAVPEAVLDHDKDDEVFATSVETTGYSAVAIGPGIGMKQSTQVAFVEQMQRSRRLIVDADGLNILAARRAWLTQVPADTILTPHQQEMRRLGLECDNCYATLAEACAHAKKYCHYIVLKGHHTAICTPSGKVYFNTTGNPGMATAGTGDVLTGILLALLADSNRTREETCLLGTYLHGLAGALAAEQLGQESLTAHDIKNFLPQAFQALEKDHTTTTTKNTKKP